MDQLFPSYSLCSSFLSQREKLTKYLIITEDKAPKQRCGYNDTYIYSDKVSVDKVCILSWSGSYGFGELYTRNSGREVGQSIVG